MPSGDVGCRFDSGAKSKAKLRPVIRKLGRGHISPDSVETTEPRADLDQATMWAELRFDGFGDKVGRTPPTQHIVLKGENASEYVVQVQTAFMSSLAAGRNKIAAGMERP